MTDTEKTNKLKLQEWNNLILNGNLSTIQSALQNKEIAVNDKLGEYEISPLHLSVWHNHLEVTEFLLSEKIPPYVKEEAFSGKTPLHIAAYFGHIDVAKILIAKKEKIIRAQTRDNLSCHAIHYAALGEKKEMLFFLLEIGHLLKPTLPKNSFSAKSRSWIGNSLDILIRRRNFSLCDEISSYEGISIVETNPRVGTDMYIGYRYEWQWTPFHSAAVLGEKKILEMLLKKFPGAYCFAEEFARDFDFKPGDLAQIEGHTEVAQLLGCKKNKKQVDEVFNQLLVLKDAPEYASSLLEALLQRNFLALDQLLEEHGEKIFYQKNYDVHNAVSSLYYTNLPLNALSAIARLFCASASDWFHKKSINIPIQEFVNKDKKDQTFLNWAMSNVHPYATGFFETLDKEIKYAAKQTIVQ